MESLYFQEWPNFPYSTELLLVSKLIGVITVLSENKEYVNGKWQINSPKHSYMKLKRRK